MSRRRLYKALHSLALALATARHDGLVPARRSRILERGCHRRANRLNTRAMWVRPRREKAKARRQLRKTLDFLQDAIGVELADLNEDDPLAGRIAALTRVLEEQGSDRAVW